MKFETGIIFLISVLGATGAIMTHLTGTYATVERVHSLENQIRRIDKVQCAMAIHLNVPDIKKICNKDDEI